jgi:uncharacterized protein (TIGR03086 family)
MLKVSLKPRCHDRMMTTSDPVDQLETVLAAAQPLVAGVRDDQWSSPTPCADWSVRDLVSHVVSGNFLFASVLRGEPPLSREEILRSRPDLARAYRESAAVLVDAFRQPGVLERMVSIPAGNVPGVVALHIRITEILVHGWDLARATRQRTTFPQDVAEQELTISQKNLSLIPPQRSPFAPPQPVAPDAPAIDRLAALLGRQPG